MSAWWLFSAVLSVLLLAFGLNAESKTKFADDLELLVVTVATDANNDGLRRLKDSANKFGINLKVFGTNEKWNGGDMRNNAGGAQKIRILRNSLEEGYKLKRNLLILFVDAYDVIFNANPETIIQRFLHSFGDFRVVFSAESFCWPDKTLASSYPIIKFGEKYLNSGIFMGYTQEIMQILELGADLEDNDDDQLFYTKIYLEKRKEYKMTLDHLSLLFQNLNGMKEHVIIHNDNNGDFIVFNKLYNTHPVVIHGNGPSKIHLNYLGNYIAGRFNSETGCVYCQEHQKNIDSPEQLIGLAIFIVSPIPYVEEFLEHIEKLNYDKSLIELLLVNQQPYNTKSVEDFLKRTEGQYAFVSHYKEYDDEPSKIINYRIQNI